MGTYTQRCFESSRPTTHDQPTYIEEGVVHYCVANIPGAVPRTATAALSRATFPHISAIANGGWREALAADVGLAAGLSVSEGKLYCPAVARAQAPLACGGSAFGVRLFSEDVARQVMQPRIFGKDLVTGVPQTFGLGFGIVPESLPLSPNKNTCYWGGWGGSAVVIDQDARISAAYVMNKMADGLVGDFRAFKLLGAVYRNL